MYYYVLYTLVRHAVLWHCTNMHCTEGVTDEDSKEVNDFECSLEQATLQTFVAALLSSIRIRALANKIVGVFAR